MKKKFKKYLLWFLCLFPIWGGILFAIIDGSFYTKTPSFIIYENSKAYKLFLKTYNSNGHEEFVDNYIRSYKLASKINPDIKFKFLLLVYLNCYLDVGDWLYFCSEIQDDDNFFWKRLDSFMKSDDFKKLPLRFQKQIKDANESYLDDNQHFDVHL